MKKITFLKEHFMRVSVSLLALGLLAIGLVAPLSYAEELVFDPFGSTDLCENLGDDGVLHCEDDESSSFTNFEGDFAPPDEEGYAEGITTTSSAREFVVNVTNFVLGFLGLAAVVVIIYGGILYVTAAGEQERADKGKKSLMYAVTGLIIVLGSFAIVNTIILGAASGDDDAVSDGLYSSGDVSSESLRSFQAEQMSEDLKDYANDFVDSYAAYVNIMAILDAMDGLAIYDDDALAEYEEGFELIEDQADSLSEASDKTSEALQFLRNYISYNFMDHVGKFVNFEEWGQANIIQVASGAAGDLDLPKTQYMDGTGDDDVPDNDPYGIGSDIENYMDEVAEAALEDFQTDVSEIYDAIDAMKGSFEGLDTIYTTFESLLAELEDYDSNSYLGEEPPGGSRQVADIVDYINTLYTMIQDLEFTEAVITVNTDEGNYPLTVTFDALDSYDPSDLTIDSDHYVWDLAGDGFESGGDDDQTGPSVSYTYENSGTYRVALRVDSMSPDNDIASGISYISIKVNPPSSIIHLTGTAQLGGGTSTTDLTDLSTWTVTGEQAKSGITFDAGETTDGEGNYDTIVDFEFEFGDGEVFDGESASATHYYESEGTYDFVLEVTDQNGMTDRKMFDLIVASPAAHISADDQTVEIGDTVTFDASGSVTDQGSIETYTWTITKDGETEYTDETTEDYLEYTFDTPGEYTVTVTVVDSTGDTNEASVTVTVASSEPVALFTYENPDSTMPNRFNFDAGNSYDPDEGDTLTFEWTVEGTEGTDYDFVEGTTSADEEPTIDFNMVGEYDVTLTVYDQYDESLQQKNSYTREVEVESVLNISAEFTDGSAAFLDEESNEATVEITLESNYGVSYEIDWGDEIGESETIPVTTMGTAETVQHVYSMAGTHTIDITVEDDDGNTNHLTRNAHIGDGTVPLPVVTVYVDNVESADSTNVTGFRTNTFRFDASESVDVDGRPLEQSNSFSWDFGDGSTPTTGERLTHTYDEVGTFEATLTVYTEEDELEGASNQMMVIVDIVDTPPTIYSIIVSPVGDEMVTPLQVNVTVNAEDEDGEINTYKFWYYDVGNSSEKMDTQINTSNTATLTVNTNGESGEVIEYAFAASVTDDENNVVYSEDELTESQIPTLEVENGPNQSPVADFTVSESDILLGEEITFTSSSYDEDGEIISYIWDLEGDGFYNNDETTESSITHTYDETAKDGIQVRLKVEDDSGATDVSDPIRIYVDTLTEEPLAGFLYEVEQTGDEQWTVTFENTSVADEANGATIASYSWDLDGSENSNGRGTETDDVDSTEENPVHVYEETDGKNSYSYPVYLTVTDSEGNTNTKDETIKVYSYPEPEAMFDFSVDGLTVKFDGSYSEVVEELSIDSYEWDFGDGETSNEEISKHTYSEHGIYDIYLTITDSLGRTSTAQDEIDLSEPDLSGEEYDLTATLYPDIAPDPSDNKIHLTPDSGTGNASLRFWYSAEGVYGTPVFCIDQDTDYTATATEGHGAGDDCDYPADGHQYANGEVIITYSKDWNPITTKLTVTDEGTEFDPDRKSEVTVDIVVDDDVEEGAASASTLPVTTAEALYIFATALLFTVLGAKIYTRKENI